MKSFLFTLLAIFILIGFLISISFLFFLSSDINATPVEQPAKPKSSIAVEL